MSLPDNVLAYFRERRWNVPVVELVLIDWRTSDRVVWYSSDRPELKPRFAALADRGILTETRLVNGFRTLPRTYDLADESVPLKLWDGDGAITALYQANGAGVRCEVFSYYPDVDYLKSEFWGHLKQPEKGDGYYFETKIESGFRSGTIQVPRGAFYTTCSAIFAGHYRNQTAIDNGPCPYNRHLDGGTVGNLDTDGQPFKTCPKTRAACTARLGEDLSFYGFQTVTDTHIVTQTKGPNLGATTRGNETNLKDPPAVVAGRWKRRDLPILAYTPEPNTNHPDKGSLRVLFHLGVGPLQSATLTEINGRYPQSSTVGGTQVRLGEYRQAKTTFSSNVANYSGQGVVYGVDNPGDFRNTKGSDIGGAAEIYGQNNVRVFAADGTIFRAYDTNRALWLMHLYLERWGLGYDIARLDLAAWKYAADWCDEAVTACDSVGDCVLITRSTFNQLLTGRNARDHVYDICVSGRLGLPSLRNGKLSITPLERVADLQSVPLFTDEGPYRNIIKGERGSSLEYKELKVPTSIKLTFVDAAADWTEYALLFSDDVAALREGVALGDDSVKHEEKEHTAFGVTSLEEATRLGNLLLALGPLDEGGLENPLEISFTTWSLLAEALELQPYSVIKVVSKKILGFTERTSGRQFEYFRIKKMERGDDLKLKITAQAYPVDFYDLSESQTQSLPVQSEAAQPSPTVPDTLPIVAFDE